MARTLENKVALVTGSAQGLGEAIALRLAQEGAHIAVADLNGEGANAVAQKIVNSTDRKAIGLAVNVTDEEQVEAAVSRTVQELGGLNILVANAGIVIAGDIRDFEVSKWRTVIEVNLVGYMLFAKHAAKAMIDSGGGAIVQINSKSGKKGGYRNSAYCASKFGGIGLTQSLALELAEHNIRVNAICPGNLLDSPLWVNSLYDQYAKKWGIPKEEVRPMYEAKVPLGRGCAYDDVTNMVVFLASDASSYTTGQAINVTGGEEMR